MKIRTPPTRMALLRLRRRLAVAERGHRLLEDKLEGLIRRFMETVDAYGGLRREMDMALPQALGGFRLAAGASGEEAVAGALEECGGGAEIAVVSRRVLSTTFPVVTLAGFALRPAYSSLTTTTDFDWACAGFRDLFPKLLALASKEEELLRMATEVERTRRRVHALEYVLIPGLRQAINDIAAKLEEANRSTRARLMKVKAMLEGF